MISRAHPLTVLDYIDELLSLPDAYAKYDVGQVVGIRDILVDLYGGKRANEMAPTELARRTADVIKYDTSYQPLAIKEWLPSPKETLIVCTPSDLAKIQKEVEYVYDLLGHEKK